MFILMYCYTVYVFLLFSCVMYFYQVGSFMLNIEGYSLSEIYDLNVILGSLINYQLDLSRSSLVHKISPEYSLQSLEIVQPYTEESVRNFPDLYSIGVYPMLCIALLELPFEDLPLHTNFSLHINISFIQGVIRDIFHSLICYRLSIGK